MTAAVQSPVLPLVEKEKEANIAIEEGDAYYWWRTSGQDLSRMLQEAGYPDEAKRQFLNFFRETICPTLGGKPDSNALRTAVGWDGSPFEYSFEFKESTKSAGVRFVVDLTQLRPGDKTAPLTTKTSENVIESLAKRTPLFDDNWHRALSQWFVYSQASESEQKALVAAAGYQTNIIMGFDINAKILDLAPGYLPVMAKSYFPPCFVAEAKGFTRWQALSLGIRQIPDIGLHPNILLALKMIEDYVAAKPELAGGARGLSTDFVKAGKARLKIYMRYTGDDFEEVWDYYTLGGKIPDLESDKEMFRDLMTLSSPSTYTAEDWKHIEVDPRRRAAFKTKPTAVYFSLSPDKPYPIPKVYFYPARAAPNDKVIARGLDAWLTKYKWHDGGKSVEERVETVFTHRKLEENPGIFTFIGLGRKEDSTKKGLSLQVYMTPELYVTPRF
ncbi:aromatic prenyltransferase [Annulohypoxylon truncatum]|uniref:aromatic prenyltransferase n=1 Tax=Annulohypoxylon truncatum TaxID=327061 RepID=UPI002007B3B5|nr:aromatic prenyltransferase [Annulohypoxylon truncatum]KAI1206384.1 aromatic prenyltransferase [Annulohypoxylon truncatum]